MLLQCHMILASFLDITYRLSFSSDYRIWISPILPCRINILVDRCYQGLLKLLRFHCKNNKQVFCPKRSFSFPPMTIQNHHIFVCSSVDNRTMLGSSRSNDKYLNEYLCNGSCYSLELFVAYQYTFRLISLLVEAVRLDDSG